MGGIILTKVQLKKWGNSQGIRIPKEVLDILELPSDALFDLKIDKKTNTIFLVLDNNVTPYEKLIINSSDKERISFKWESVGSELL